MEVGKHVFNLIEQEKGRQRNTIELIASENFVSEAVMKAVGSCLTNKYAEGYPAHRYYGGTYVVDALESYCMYLWQRVFKTNYFVNVQPHSGSQANFAAISAICNPGDTILSMDLSCGGHLSHGAPANITGKLYNIVHYGVDEDGYISMSEVRELARQYQPKLIIAGASSYPRSIDFETFANIAKEVGAAYLVDMAHIAGLVAARYHKSPFGLADIVTTTTHKTLRGPRGGLIFCKPGLEKKINSAVFPGCQGGPLMHVIAGKAVCAEEALEPEYAEYIRDVVRYSHSMCAAFKERGYTIVTGGTDTHMFVVDLRPTGLSGKCVQDRLDYNGIAVNKQCIPNDPRSVTETSGIRIGTPAMTTRGYTEADFRRVAHEIMRIIEEEKVR